MHVSIISPEQKCWIEASIISAHGRSSRVCGHDKYDEWDLFYSMDLLN